MSQQKSAIKTSELFAFFTRIIYCAGERADRQASQQFASNCSFMIVSSLDKTRNIPRRLKLICKTHSRLGYLL